MDHLALFVSSLAYPLWLIRHPARASTTYLSAFSYSPQVHTPKYRPNHPRGSPSSWLSSPTASPESIPPWSYSPSIPSPKQVITRPRSQSPTPVTDAGPTPRAPIKGSQPTPFSAYSRTLTSTPGSALRSPGGSIIAGYEPDPFHPLPRSFESLTSYPLSPSQMATTSRVNLTCGTFAFVPEEKASTTGKGSSTWTLESYHAEKEMKTPDPKSRRAPPPPPIPMGMPLPPTPSLARPESMFDLPRADLGELPMGEKEWVEVKAGGDGLDGWGLGGKGVGVMAVGCVTVCWVSAETCTRR